MNITDVKAFVVQPPGRVSGSTEDRQWTFVRISTDEGLVGVKLPTTQAGEVS